MTTEKKRRLGKQISLLYAASCLVFLAVCLLVGETPLLLRLLNAVVYTVYPVILFGAYLRSSGPNPPKAARYVTGFWLAAGGLLFVVHLFAELPLFHPVHIVFCTGSCAATLFLPVLTKNRPKDR